MKLPHPERAHVPRAKIVDYLLSSTHPDGRSKAAFFVRFGFSLNEWQTLAAALLAHARALEITRTERSPFGTRYIVEGIIHTPDARDPLIRSVWFTHDDDDTPRFVTAYPL